MHYHEHNSPGFLISKELRWSNSSQFKQIHTNYHEKRHKDCEHILAFQKRSALKKIEKITG